MWRKLLSVLLIVLSISAVTMSGCVDVGDDENDEPVVDIDVGDD